jgi:hypothetical protein
MLVHVWRKRRTFLQDRRARYARLAGIARHSESGLARRACLAPRARRALETLANFFSILVRPTQPHSNLKIAHVSRGGLL